MKASDIPANKFPIPFAADAGGSYIRPIPEASQIGIQDGAASLHDGFPPLTFIPRASGGSPPFGQDVNGILFQTTSWSQWFNAGGAVPWDSTFSTAIGGYPNGSIVASATTDGVFWRSTSDDNTTNPDTGGANWVPAWRTRFIADTTFYVATTGNDITGKGTSGSPWATVAHAYAVIANSYDLSGFVATIQVADGTYAGVQTLSGPLLGQIGPANLIINGNAVTPANVTMALAGVQRAMFQPQNLKIANAAGDGLAASFGASINLGPGIVFGACSQAQIDAFRTGTISLLNNYTINGSAPWHMLGAISGTIQGSGITANLIGTPAFSTAFIQAAQASCITDFTAVFVGLATGVRYLATENGVISTNGGGASYFPGSIAGSVATGGQYS